MRALLAPSLLALLALGGCERPNPAGTSLDEPLALLARGASQRSQLEVHRQGPLDPAGTDAAMRITDATVGLRVIDGGAAGRVEIQLLDLALGDVDLPRSRQLPDGLKVRAQRLYAAGPLQASVVERGPDRLVAAVEGTLRYHAGLLLDDGVIYPLGDAPASGSLTLSITRDEAGAHLTLDAPPADACGQLGDLLTFTRCSLFVESDGTR